MENDIEFGLVRALYMPDKLNQTIYVFFHRGLRSLVAVDLKISEFMPEYISKMNLYLSLLDRLERGKDENPSIGIILCAEKDTSLAYAA